MSFRAQVQDPKNVVGEWVEPAADTSLESKIVVKHDQNSATVRRRLISRRVNAATITRGLRPITVNFTVVYDVEHTAADILAAMAFIDATSAASGVKANLLAGMI
jgi:hypothetical protein